MGSLFPQNIYDLAAAVVDGALKKKVHLVTAESCTGGLISGALTEVPGCSEVFDRGFVSYSYDAKMAQLSVDRKTLNDFGAVSAETVLEMAEGALTGSHADLAVSVTGIAGPGGATAEKPLGLVYIGIANGRTKNSYTVKNNFTGDRSAVRMAVVETALELLKKEIDAL